MTAQRNPTAWEIRCLAATSETCRDVVKGLWRDFPAATISINEFGDHVWVWDLGVRVQSRGNGIGTELMRRVQQWCHDNHRDIRLSMEAEPDHEAGLARFYARIGFAAEDTGRPGELVWWHRKS